MERPTLPGYKLSKTERAKFDRQCHAWDLASRLGDEVTEVDVEQAYAVLAYVGRLANLEYKNAINNNTIKFYGTIEHRDNLLRAAKARSKAKEMLAPYNATLAYFGPMPTIVETNTNRDLYVGHW